MTSDRASTEHATPPLWRNRDFQLLFAGSLTSVVGSEIAAIAYPLLVLAVTGSPAQAGLVAFAETAAAVLVGLPAGALVDRWNKRAVMVTCDALRLVAAGSIPLALAANRLSLTQIVAVAAVTGAAGSFFYPARMVAVRRTVSADQLSAALSQNQARVAIGALVGPSAGGALFGLGRALPFLADAVSFGVSLLCVLGIRTPLRVEPDGSTGQRRLGAEITEGFAWIWARRQLRAMLLYATAVNLAAGALLLLVIVLASNLGASPSTVGLILTGAAVGSLLGAVASAWLQRHVSPPALMLLVGGVASVAICAMALPFGVAWIGLTLGTVMVFSPAAVVAINLMIMRDVPERLQGRAMSAMDLLLSVARPLGPLVAGVLLEYAGARVTAVLLGGYLALCVILAVTNPGFRGRSDRDRPAEDTIDPAPAEP